MAAEPRIGGAAEATTIKRSAFNPNNCAALADDAAVAVVLPRTGGRVT
jgi:hypothetical protein